MESDSHLVRAYVPANNSIRVVRRAEFHPLKVNRLPGVSSLIDGLARQKGFENQSKKVISVETDLEERLMQTMHAIHHNFPFDEYIGTADS